MRFPKAVVSVDLYGQTADYGRLVPLCEEYGVALVEDAAEALGATHRGAAAGSFGAAGVFSFNGNKIITTSGGGMLVTVTTDHRRREPGTWPPRPASPKPTTSTSIWASTTA